MMNMQTFIDNIAYKAENKIGDSFSQCYFSKTDNSYLTHVGMEDNLNFLKERGITEQIQCGTGHAVANIGFNPIEKKWYGWSHRAIYGFGIGSECKKGECHFRGSTEHEQEEEALQFWKDEHHVNVRNEGVVEKNGERYFDIKWEYTDDVPNEKIRGSIGGVLHHIKPLGKGEWVAQSLDDAKQMACDFAEGVG